MKDSTKSSRVSPSQVADRRKAKSLLVKDHPARISTKPKSSHSHAVRSKNHLAWYVALNIKQSEKKISHIPQIKWKCPPKFALNTGWHVAAGEESQEAEAQKCRESAVLEVAFTDLTAIPPCPFTSSLVEGDCHDDSQTPIIPIEEMVAEMPFDTSATVNTSINPQPPASSCLSVSGDPSESQDQSIHGKSLSHTVHGLESGDLEIAAAAAATVAAAMQSKDQIDTELLIKFLIDPEMIKKLMNGNGLTSKSEDEAPPAPKAITCSPLPSSTPPASVVDKLANGRNEPVSKATVSNSTPEPVSQSLIVPCSKVETEMNKVASKLGAGSGPKHTPKAAKRPSHSPRFNSGGLTRKLSAFSCTNQIAREQKARPLAPPNLRPDEETIDRLVKKYGGPNFTGVKPMGSLNPSTPMLNLEAVKKMIHDYGSPDVDRVKPMAPLAAPASVPPNREEIHKTVEKYLLPDHGWGKTFMGPSHSLLASSPSPPVTSLPSHVDATGIFHPSFAPMTVRAREVNLQYQKSLIKQHGEIHESGENKVPKICQSGNYLQGVKRAHNITTTEMNPKYQKPCIYFTSATGCRNGYNCLFRHDARVTGAVVAPIKPVAMAPVAKKMKLNEQFGKMAMKWH